MNLKNLGKATSIFTDIKVLDAEIIEIERFAMIAANNETESSFELKVIDKEPKEGEKKNILDEYGSLIQEAENMPRKMMRHMMFGYMSDRIEDVDKKANVHTLKHSLSVNATMQILGVLLHEKQNKRLALIKKLESMGVNL